MQAEKTGLTNKSLSRSRAGRVKHRTFVYMMVVLTKTLILRGSKVYGSGRNVYVWGELATEFSYVVQVTCPKIGGC